MAPQSTWEVTWMCHSIWIPPGWPQSSSCPIFRRLQLSTSGDTDSCTGVHARARDFTWRHQSATQLQAVGKTLTCRSRWEQLLLHDHCFGRKRGCVAPTGHFSSLPQALVMHCHVQSEPSVPLSWFILVYFNWSLYILISPLLSLYLFFLLCLFSKQQVLMIWLTQSVA